MCQVVAHSIQAATLGILTGLREHAFGTIHGGDPKPDLCEQQCADARAAAEIDGSSGVLTKVVPRPAVMLMLVPCLTRSRVAALRV